MKTGEPNGSFGEYASSARDLLGEILSKPSLLREVDRAVEEIASVLQRGKPVLVAGNGGSASDALHISGELVGKFYRDRKALNVVCLNSNVTVMTAWSNDVTFDSVFERQVEAHGVQGGLLWGLSTSGNSKNLVRAFEMARAMGMMTFAMTGSGGGALGPLSDLLFDVPSGDTPRVQEIHVLAYHYICREVERVSSNE